MRYWTISSLVHKSENLQHFQRCPYNRFLMSVQQIAFFCSRHPHFLDNPECTTKPLWTSKSLPVEYLISISCSLVTSAWRNFQLKLKFENMCFLCVRTTDLFLDYLSHTDFRDILVIMSYWHFHLVQHLFEFELSYRF